MDTLAQAAAQLGAWLSVGVSERDEAGSTLYNTLLHFAPDGTLAARHRKLMPTGGERLVWGMGDGSTLDVIDTGFGRLGGLICWENYMPLARAALYARGIDILPGAHLGQLRRLGADPAAHRQRGPHLRDRRHLLHPRHRPARGPARAC